MTASIITLSAAWIYLVMVVFTFYIIKPIVTGGDGRRIAFAVFFWFIFWPAVFLTSAYDKMKGRRFV
ncbi:hypothetical protein EV128_125154 [Rhizobium azibense]|nr:hypothetical protein EV128_125154 [Rhizobium azibense]